MSPLGLIAVVALCLLAAASAAPVDDESTPELFADDGEDYRLPLSILPINYDIALTPYLMESDGTKQFTFDGEATIRVNATEAVQHIVMHTKNLNYTVRQYWAVDTPTTIINLDNFEENSVTDKINYTLANNLLANTVYVLHFVYNGTMDDDMHGFYRSSYTDSAGETKWIGSTQFQTNHARRAFPSFDEPKFKATFNVNLTHHNSMRSWSNTNNISYIVDGDSVTDVYAQTPKMSTYILAFIIADFDIRSNDKFGVIARPEYYDQTEYSFDVGQLILDYLSDYMGIPYYTMGVEKMHMAAIPDFSAGAMENWGLLTYRERAVLYENTSTTLSSKQYIAAVVAHEQAHMWFGDLVTCDWWSYTWLNEGFARYFQYFGTAMIETDLDLDKQFIVDQVQTVMSMDSTNSTNPLSNEDTNSPSELSTMFNSISYNKGASFIRMVRHAMGETSFQAALRDYLGNNSYQSTVPQNLFDHWKNHWSSPYADDLFTSFTEQVGYPVLYVDVATSGENFTVTQKRFLLNSADGSDDSLVYVVPFTYTTNSELNFEDTTPKMFLEANNSAVTVPLGTDDSWVIANIQETGYYRVNYNTENWYKIHAALYTDNWGNIHEMNRAQLVDDLLNLARSSEISYDLALEILEYLETETNYLPWTAAFNGFTYLAIRLGTDTGNFASYILEITEKAYGALGFVESTNDATLDIYNRAKILAWACKYGNSECITKSKALFDDMDNTAVPVNIRSVVYCVAMREGSEEDFDKLFNRYLNETGATENTLLLNSLGCVKDTALVTKFFNIILSDDVRRQDKSSALAYLYIENNENISPVFELVTENFDSLADALGSYSSVASVISSIAARFTEQEQLDALISFNDANEASFGTSSTTLRNAETTVATNLQWSSEKLSVFREYLLQRTNGSTSMTASSLLSLLLFVLTSMLLR